MRYYEMTKWEKIGIKEKYNQCVEYIIRKIIKTIDRQQLICWTTLNNFAVNTWPNYYVDKSMFLIKWQLEFVK